MLAFGIVGYVFKKLDYPLAPLVLALVLGDRAEDAFRQSMLASRGGLGIFWANGLVGTIMTLAVAGLGWSLLGSLRARFFPRPAAAASSGGGTAQPQG
jgi:TctA family transporter